MLGNVFVIKRQRLVEELSDDEVTEEEKNFDKTRLEINGNNNQQSELCRKCSIAARMFGPDHQGWKASGMCESHGCPGYRGRPPTSGPQGDRDDSDDVPLLFSPLSECPMSHSIQEMDLVDHCHGEEPRRESTKSAKRQLLIATVLCSIFVTGEVVGGYLSGSLAIMGDAAHMFSDLASFGVSLLVLYISDRKSTKAMTYGYHRAEALGALATLCIIWYVTGILVYLAIRRIHDQDFEIHDTTMLVVASAAVAFNILLGLTLHGVCGLGHGHSHGGGHGHSHGGRKLSNDSVSSQKHINIRAAFIHVLGDLLQSIGVLISSLLIKFFGPSFKVADPICTLIFAVIVVLTTLTVLRDTLSILLEGSPADVKYDDVHRDLSNIGDVVGVHSLHIWSLTADIPVVSAHLTTKNETVDHNGIRNEAIKILRNKHQIWRSTIQIEPHRAQAMNSCDKCQSLA